MEAATGAAAAPGAATASVPKPVHAEGRRILNTEHRTALRTLFNNRPAIAIRGKINWGLRACVFCLRSHFAMRRKQRQGAAAAAGAATAPVPKPVSMKRARVWDEACEEGNFLTEGPHGV